MPGLATQADNASTSTILLRSYYYFILAIKYTNCAHTGIVKGLDPPGEPSGFLWALSEEYPDVRAKHRALAE
jgi:hypothetical protein